MLADLRRDLRYALRIFIKNPGFTAVAVLTLSLGIGVTTAIFSMVGNILIRPLPYPDSDRIVTLLQSYAQKGLDRWRLSQADFALYREQSQMFDSLAAYSVTGLNLTGVEKPERLIATKVTADFFKVLAVNPTLGRTFVPGEDAPGKSDICILSYSFWNRHFNRDPRVIGMSMVLNNASVQIVGVMPEGFQFPVPTTELWVPLGLNPQAWHPYFLTGIARLKSGASPQLAQAETTRILWSAGMQNPRLVGRDDPPPAGSDLKTLVTPLKEAIIGKTATPLLVLQSAVAFILLIACANIANLLLSRTAARSREVALRYALGGTPRRVLKQLLTESLLLGLCGVVPGVLIAWTIIGALSSMPLKGIPRIDEVRIDGAVLFFAVGIALLTGLLVGLVPSLQASKLGLRGGLNDAQRGSSESSGGWMKDALVGGQLALSLILLVGAGLVLKSFRKIVAVQPGFQAEKVLTMLLPVTNQKYPAPEQAMQFYKVLESSLSAIPGVSSAAVSSNIPFSGEESSDGYIVEGHEPPPGSDPTQAQLQTISPGYFHTMGASLERGRDFVETDQANTPPVVIVDQTLANKYWPDGNAVGKRVRTTGDQTWMTVVGVVNGVKDQNLAEGMKPHLYSAHGQDPQLRMYLVVKTSGDPLMLVAPVRNKIRELDADIPVYAIRPLNEVLGQTLDRQKLVDGLLTGFAVLAMVLAAIGIYGVMSIHVASRTREFGIRIAIGAQPADVLYSVLKPSILLIVAGVSAGLIGAFLCRVHRGSASAGDRGTGGVLSACPEGSKNRPHGGTQT